VTFSVQMPQYFRLVLLVDRVNIYPFYVFFWSKVSLASRLPDVMLQRESISEVFIMGPHA
jgi:hypothetical protein